MVQEIQAAIIFLTISIAGLTLASSNLALAQTSTNSDMQILDNPTLGFRLQYPLDWMVKEGEGAFLITLTPSSQPYISLQITKVKKENENISSLKNIAEVQASSDGGTLLQSKQVKMNEKPAYMVLYTIYHTNSKARIMFAVSFDTVSQEYIRFKYQSPEPTYDSYISAVGNIIKSVEFKNNVQNPATSDQSTSELPSSDQSTSELPSQTQRPTIQNLLSHSNQALGVSLQYPSDWKVIDAKENTIEITKETGVTYMEIHVQPLKSKTLEEYVDTDISSRKKSRTDFKFIENPSKSVISGNMPAYDAIYTFLKTADPGKGQTQKILRICTITNDKSYTIIYTSPVDTYDRYLGTANAIIDSIKIGERSER